jgi:hypothetical protein
MLHGFFSYAQEREAIRQRREADEAAVARGEAPQGPPWTQDPILQAHRFCNVYREDDKTTRWFAKNVRAPWAHDDAMSTWVAFLFRWFNYIPSGELLLKHDLFRVWDYTVTRRVFADAPQVVTGAYVVKTPNGLRKVEGIIKCVEMTRDMRVLEHLHEHRTLQTAHAELMKAPYMGPFMAYEVITDLRHTSLRHAEDINLWASAGPGAARGLDWVLGGPKRYYNHAPTQARMQEEMRYILDASRDPALWPHQDRPWEMREVEHTLCEFDKYMRGLSGQPLKRHFKGGPQ